MVTMNIICAMVAMYLPFWLCICGRGMKARKYYWNYHNWQQAGLVMLPQEKRGSKIPLYHQQLRIFSGILQAIINQFIRMSLVFFSLFNTGPQSWIAFRQHGSDFVFYCKATSRRQGSVCIGTDTVYKY